jgi:DNA-binding MarR family transcriptional regulator
VATKTIELTQGDLASLKRLLSSLSASAPEAEPDPISGVDVRRPQLLRMARISFAVRRRRADYLHRAMLGEPAYDMLLGLYVAEGDEQLVTASRLADIAGVAPSSAMRWIEYLVGKDLVHRGPHPTDKRASILRLSAAGRAALEGVFMTMLEGLEDAAI